MKLKAMQHPHSEIRELLTRERVFYLTQLQAAVELSIYSNDYKQITHKT